MKRNVILLLILIFCFVFCFSVFGQVNNGAMQATQYANIVQNSFSLDHWQKNIIGEMAKNKSYKMDEKNLDQYYLALNAFFIDVAQLRNAYNIPPATYGKSDCDLAIYEIYPQVTYRPVPYQQALLSCVQELKQQFPLAGNADLYRQLTELEKNLQDNELAAKVHFRISQFLTRKLAKGAISQLISGLDGLKNTSSDGGNMRAYCGPYSPRAKRFLNQLRNNIGKSYGVDFTNQRNLFSYQQLRDCINWFRDQSLNGGGKVPTWTCYTTFYGQQGQPIPFSVPLERLPSGQVLTRIGFINQGSYKMVFDSIVTLADPRDLKVMTVDQTFAYKVPRNPGLNGLPTADVQREYDVLKEIETKLSVEQRKGLERTLYLGLQGSNLIMVSERYHRYDLRFDPTVPRSGDQIYSSKMDRLTLKKHFVDCAQGLETLQSTLGWVHNDIKAENLMYSDRGCVVIDFGGCSKLAEGLVPFGTPGYIPPEKFAGMSNSLAIPATKSSDETIKKNDVFSLALTYFELYTDNHSFWRCNYLQQKTYADYRDCFNTEVESKINEYQQKTGDPVFSILKEALAEDPQSRPSLSEFKRKLSETLSVPASK